MEQGPRVTIRNLLKTKVQEYQLDTLKNGGLYWTFRSFLQLGSPDQIESQKKPKSAFFLFKLPLFPVDTSGHQWTCKSGIGLRKGYEFHLEVSTGPRSPEDSILSSSPFFSNLIKFNWTDFKTASRGIHGEAFYRYF